MPTNQPPPSGQRDQQAPGIVFLACGFAFLVVGMATKLHVFALTAPAFIALGIVFLIRARRRPDDRDPN